MAEHRTRAERIYEYEVEITLAHELKGEARMKRLDKLMQRAEKEGKPDLFWEAMEGHKRLIELTELVTQGRL